MATVLDPSDPEVRAAADTARETLIRLRAQPFVERLDAAMARDSGGAATERSGRARAKAGVAASDS
jgi:hypothetical protein